MELKFSKVTKMKPGISKTKTGKIRSTRNGNGVICNSSVHVAITDEQMNFIKEQCEKMEGRYRKPSDFIRALLNKEIKCSS